MQKKFLFSVIIAVSMVTVFGLFTSCKDYDDDINSLHQELIDTTTSLQKALQTQIDAINKEIADLKAQQAACKENCQKVHAELLAQIVALQGEVDALKAKQSQSEEEQAKQAAEIEALKNQIAAHKLEIDDLKAKYDALKTQYTELSVTINTVQAQLEKIDAHLSQVEDVVKQQGETIADQEKAIEQLTQTTIALQTAINDANTALAALKVQVEKNNEAIKANADNIEKNAEAIKANTDKIANLESLMVGMQEDLKKVQEDAQSALTTAKAAYDLAKQDADDIETLKKTVDKNTEDIDANKKAIGQNAEAIALIYGDIDKINGKISDLDGKVSTNTNDIKDIKAALETITKDVAANKKAISDLETSLNSKISTLQTKLDETTALAKEAKELAQQANDTAALALANSIANKAAIEGLTTDVNTLKDKLVAIATWQTEVNGKISDIYDQLALIPTTYYTKDEVDSKLATLKQDLEEEIQEIKDKYATKADVDSYLKTLHQTINGQMDNLRSELMYKIDQVDAKFANYYNKTEVLNLLKDYYTKSEIDEMFNNKLADYYTKSEIDAKLSDIDGRLTAVEAKFDEYYNKTEVDQKVEDLDKAYKKADEELNDKIVALNKKLNSVIGELNTLKDSYEKFVNKMNQLITSIVVQGTYNPVIGTFNLPTNLSSNILSAFYGKSTKDAPNWPVCSNGLTNEEATLVGLSENFPVYSGDLMLSDDDKAYAGKVYLTVNPSSVDFSNTTFTLVNSKDEESVLKLGALAPCSEEITFGWTRGAAANGFYEADAYIDMADVESVKATNYIDVESLKAVAKEALNKIKDPSKNEFNVANAYKVIESSLSTTLPALGVKSWWQWKDEDNNIQTSSTYSQYAIAGVAVQPLSYEFLKDWDAPQIKTIAHQEFEFAFNIDMPSFNPIVEPDVKVTVYQVKATISVGGTPTSILIGVCTTNDASATGAQGVKNAWDANHTDPSEKATIFEQTFTAQGLSDFVNQINTNIISKANTDFEKLKNDINKQIKDEINKITNKLNTKVIDRVNKVINKINSVIKNANHYLQPTMLYFNQTTNKWCIISNSMVVPTAVKLGSSATNFVLVEPTTYTAELLSPAYKKYVAVTNVIKSDFSANAKGGDGTCKNILAEANSNGVGMNEIYSGLSDRGVYLPQTGYIYEITYVSLDYSGNTVKTTYYFKAI